MTNNLPISIIRGVLVGLFAGLVFGTYVYVLSLTYVIQRSDYVAPVLYEQAQSRYGMVLLSTFGLVFAAIGPVVAAGSFGPWIRRAVYGLVSGIGVVVFVSLVCAACLNQQPFNVNKMAHSTSIDLARTYFIPIAFVIGPFCGILFGELGFSVRKCWAGRVSDNA